jgi:hypothetical protein
LETRSDAERSIAEQAIAEQVAGGIPHSQALEAASDLHLVAPR